MQKKILVANWKMNGNALAVDDFLKNMKEKITDDINVSEVVLCPSFVYLRPVVPAQVETMRLVSYNDKVSLGAQNVHHELQGAYTGEVSINMLSEIERCKYVIVGHSERRQYFNETNEIVAKKFATVWKSRLTPILCIGETKEQRVQGKTLNVLKEQLILILKSALTINEDMAYKKLIIAYEPVWAIGSGMVATAADIQATHKFIRHYVVEETVGRGFKPENICILYGGSVNSKNAKDTLNIPEVDGGLIGGASLQWMEFLEICKAVI